VNGKNRKWKKSGGRIQKKHVSQPEASTTFTKTRIIPNLAKYESSLQCRRLTEQQRRKTIYVPLVLLAQWITALSWRSLILTAQQTLSTPLSLSRGRCESVYRQLNTKGS
jgi:hypothetical protein